MFRTNAILRCREFPRLLCGRCRAKCAFKDRWIAVPFCQFGLLRARLTSEILIRSGFEHWDGPASPIASRPCLAVMVAADLIAVFIPDWPRFGAFSRYSWWWQSALVFVASKCSQGIVNSTPDHLGSHIRPVVMVGGNPV